MLKDVGIGESFRYDNISFENVYNVLLQHMQCMCMCMYVCMYVCVCGVCVRVCTLRSTTFSQSTWVFGATQFRNPTSPTLRSGALRAPFLEIPITQV